MAWYGAEVDAVACCGACGACCCPEPAMVVDGLDAVWCVEYERSLVFQRGIITLYCVFLWPKRDEYVSIADTDGVLLHIHTGEAQNCLSIYTSLNLWAIFRRSRRIHGITSWRKRRWHRHTRASWRGRFSVSRPPTEILFSSHRCVAGPSSRAENSRASGILLL